LNPSGGELVTGTVTANDGTLNIPGTFDIREGSICGGSPLAGPSCTGLTVGTPFCNFNVPTSAGPVDYIACLGPEPNTDVQAITVAGGENCEDGINNDADGLVDEADDECGFVLNVNPDNINPGDTITFTVVDPDGTMDTGGAIINIRQGGGAGPVVCFIDLSITTFCTYSGQSFGYEIYYAVPVVGPQQVNIEADSSPSVGVTLIVIVSAPLTGSGVKFMLSPQSKSPSSIYGSSSFSIPSLQISSLSSTIKSLPLPFEAVPMQPQIVLNPGAPLLKEHVTSDLPWKTATSPADAKLQSPNVLKSEHPVPRVT